MYVCVCLNHKVLSIDVSDCCWCRSLALLFFFQSAAVAFNNVAALVHKYYTKPPSADLDAMFLHALSFLMLVRAKEC